MCDGWWKQPPSSFGGVDIFVGNAASGVLKPVLEITPKHWAWSLDVNARSILIGAQAAAPYMQAKGWGRILSVTSIGSRRVLAEYSAVGVSKAAIEAVTRYLAVELAPAGHHRQLHQPRCGADRRPGLFPQQR